MAPTRSLAPALLVNTTAPLVERTLINAAAALVSMEELAIMKSTPSLAIVLEVNTTAPCVKMTSILAVHLPASMLAHAPTGSIRFHAAALQASVERYARTISPGVYLAPVKMEELALRGTTPTPAPA